MDGDHLVEAGQLEDPGHRRGRADERQQAAVCAQLPVYPDDLMQGGGVEERELGHVDQEQARLLGGFRAEHLGQCRGGDVGLAGEPHQGPGTIFAVLQADGHRQFGHTGNDVTSWLAGKADGLSAMRRPR